MEEEVQRPGRPRPCGCDRRGRRGRGRGWVKAILRLGVVSSYG
jgi:hypothetical protein